MNIAAITTVEFKNRKARVLESIRGSQGRFFINFRREVLEEERATGAKPPKRQVHKEVEKCAHTPCNLPAPGIEDDLSLWERLDFLEFELEHAREDAQEWAGYADECRRCHHADAHYSECNSRAQPRYDLRACTGGTNTEKEKIPQLRN